MRLLRLAVILAAVVLYFWNLWEGSLRPWDESLTAERSREIFASGEWFTIHFQGQRDFHKPPLYYWLTALSFHAFGAEEFAVRLWSVLFGLACLFFVHRFAAASTGSRDAGYLAVMILLLNPHWMNRTREGLLESGLVLGLLAGGYCLGVSSSRHRAFLAGLFMAVGTMVKNPLPLAAILLPLFTFVPGRQALTRREWAIALVTFAGFGLSWYAAQLLNSHGGFARTFVVNNIAGRMAEPIHRAPIWAYASQWWGLAPCSLVLLAAALAVAPWAGAGSFRAQRGALAMGACVLLALTFFPSKRDTYLLLAYPWLAIAAAGLLWPVLERLRAPARMIVAAVMLAGMSAFFAKSYVAFPDHAPDVKRIGRHLHKEAAPGDVVISDIRAMAATMFYAERVVQIMGVGSLMDALSMVDLHEGQRAFVVENVRRMKEGALAVEASSDYALVRAKTFGEEYGLMEIMRGRDGTP
jgi:4-amino-4-deoxy-L-arabinose transferase-like glycosyltransferase